MPYAEGRLVHDADSHVFEPPDWADQYADPDDRQPLRDFLKINVERSTRFTESLVAKHRDPDVRAGMAAEINLRKGFDGPGSFLKEDRPLALDSLGFASQLVFTTAYLGPLTIADRAKDPALARALSTAHNRGMLDFCSVDRRLLAACFVPMAVLEEAEPFARTAIEAGAGALMVPSVVPKEHSPSHVGFDPLWALAQEAGVPVVFHVGGGAPMDSAYKQNGLPAVKDWVGGDGNFTSVSYMYIPTSPMQTLATLIFDGVLERFPALRIGVIEQGAAWVPGWMRSMDSSFDAFFKHEDRLKDLSLKPSEYVRRQVRVTPYPHEPAGWIVKNAGPSVCMFSSDYPHAEGGRQPLKRFDDSLQEAGCSSEEVDAFYSGNYVDLMGPALERALGVPA